MSFPVFQPPPPGNTLPSKGAQKQTDPLAEIRQALQIQNLVQQQKQKAQQQEQAQTQAGLSSLVSGVSPLQAQQTFGLTGDQARLVHDAAAQQKFDAGVDVVSGINANPNVPEETREKMIADLLVQPNDPNLLDRLPQRRERLHQGTLAAQETRRAAQVKIDREADKARDDKISIFVGNSASIIANADPRLALLSPSEIPEFASRIDELSGGDDKVAARIEADLQRRSTEIIGERLRARDSAQGRTASNQLRLDIAAQYNITPAQANLIANDLGTMDPLTNGFTPIPKGTARKFRESRIQLKRQKGTLDLIEATLTQIRDNPEEVLAGPIIGGDDAQNFLRAFDLQSPLMSRYQSLMHRFIIASVAADQDKISDADFRLAAATMPSGTEVFGEAGPARLRAWRDMMELQIAEVHAPGINASFSALSAQPITGEDLVLKQGMEDFADGKITFKGFTAIQDNWKRKRGARFNPFTDTDVESQEVTPGRRSTVDFLNSSGLTEAAE